MTTLTGKALRRRIETEDPLYLGMPKIKLCGKDLGRLPNSLFSLFELEVLDLSPERESCLRYALCDIPAAIGRLINLRVLVIDTNDLFELPPEIGKLVNLERIALSNNHLTTLPHTFSRLCQLRSLHLANNDISEFPAEICCLKNLRFLDLSDNNLVSVPDDIRELTNLETLMLFYNELRSLPDSLCSLVQLQCLWIGNNQLKILPRHFGKLTQLDWNMGYTSAMFEGNPLVHPPLDICRMGPEVIDRYLASVNLIRAQARLQPSEPKASTDERKDLH